MHGGTETARGTGAAPIAPADLAELLASFNAVTERLRETHERLHREVGALKEQLRQANEQIERSRQLAALGGMAAGIAHEVRNPLGSIGLYARMLEQDLADRPGQRETARRIGRAVRTLDAVVGDVLSFAREARVRRELCDGAELLREALEACRPIPESIRVESHGAPGAGALVECDPALMGRALTNIVRNAIEAMTEAPIPCAGHVLSVGVRPAGAGGAPEAWLAFGVSDTGPGIRADVLERMFNPFFTTRASGTGLGLAIVHRIVDAHGGRIAVRNRAPGEGGGAIFEILLPRRAAAPTGVESPGEPSEGAPGANAREVCA